MNKRVFVAVIIAVFWAGGHTGTLSLAEPTRDESSQGIRNFAHHIFVDSLPFEKIRQFGNDAKAVETLLRMLVEDCGIQERLDGKDRRSPFCSTIVVTLSILGGGEARTRVGINNFIKQDESLAFKATKDALIALGYWVNITEKKNPGDPGLTQAINDLASCVTTAKNGSYVNNNRDKLSSDSPQLQTNPNGPTTLQCALQDNAERKHVRRAAILGLALSGSEQSRVKDTLKSLLDDPDSDNRSFQALVIEALDAHNRIADLGLACYYERESRECQDTIKNQDSQNSGNPKPHQSG